MIEKSENELWLAQKFAEAYNRLFRTIYRAIPAERERDSVDAFLLTEMPATKIGLQICLATTTERMREEAIQGRLQKELRESLSRLGYRDTWIIVNTDRAPTVQDVAAWREGVTRVVRERFIQEGTRVDIDMDEFSGDGHVSPFGSLPFRSMTIRRGVLRDGYKHLCIVDFLIVKDVLDVQTTLQGTIDLKLQKNYSDARALWVLVHPGEGAHTVEQVELTDAELHGLEKFAHVWWVYPRREAPTEILRLGGHEPLPPAYADVVRAETFEI